jgi:MFS family permease
MRSSVLNAFSSRNFRLYFLGQSISLIGTWMQRTAVYWLVYTKTESAWMVGVAVFSTQFPSFLFSIPGGVVSDRYNRFRVMVVSQATSLVQAVLLTLLVLIDSYAVWQILVLCVMLGIVNAFDVPARQAMIYDMVNNKEDLPNAIALNSSMVHAARLIGPALAGIVLEKFGASICFLINSLSFVAVIGSLFLMRLPPYKKHVHSHNAMQDLKNGFRYLRETPSISNVMFMLACMSLVALPYITLLPVFAKNVFHGQASTFGYLNSAVGLGAFAGALFLASRRSGTNLKKVLFINTLLFAAGLILFSYVTDLRLALLFMSLSGFGMMSQTTISNTLIQTTVAPVMRGRVISYYAMAFFGMQPIGGLLIGWVAQRLGPQPTILMEGIAIVVIALGFLPFLRKRELKPAQKMKIDQLDERSVETT